MYATGKRHVVVDALADTAYDNKNHSVQFELIFQLSSGLGRVDIISYLAIKLFTTIKICYKTRVRSVLNKKIEEREMYAAQHIMFTVISAASKSINRNQPKGTSQQSPHQ